MKRVDGTFSVGDFSHGARAAYEMVVMAYENGDLDTLRQHLSPGGLRVLRHRDQRGTAKGYTVEASFAGVREVKLTEAHFDSATNEADITMRFVGELTSVVRDPEGRIVEGAPNEVKQQRDIWTFTRDMTSPNPNWFLTGTGG